MLIIQQRCFVHILWLPIHNYVSVTVLSKLPFF